MVSRRILLAQLIVRLVSSLEQAFLQFTQPSRYSIVRRHAALYNKLSLGRTWPDATL